MSISHENAYQKLVLEVLRNTTGTLLGSRGSIPVHHPCLYESARDKVPSDQLQSLHHVIQ